MPHPSKSGHHGCDGAKETSWEEEDVQLHKCQILVLKINTIMVVCTCLQSLHALSKFANLFQAEAWGNAEGKRFWNFFVRVAKFGCSYEVHLPNCLPAVFPSRSAGLCNFLFHLLDTKQIFSMASTSIEYHISLLCNEFKHMSNILLQDAFCQQNDGLSGTIYQLWGNPFLVENVSVQL